MRKLIAAALLAAMLSLSGCAAGWTADGRGVAGFLWPVDDAGARAAADAAGAAAGAVGGAVFGPVGAFFGEHFGKFAAVTVFGLLGWSQGRHRGWDEKAADAQPGGAGPSTHPSAHARGDPAPGVAHATT